MNAKQALDILIAVGICSTNNISLTCSDCPLAPEECDLIHSSEVIEEAIKLLKTVKVLEPAPADPEVYVPIRKPIEAPEGPPIVKPIPSSEDILTTTRKTGMICKECPHKKVLQRFPNTTKDVWCCHQDQEYVRLYFKEHKIRKAEGFIGFVNSKGDFPIKKSPKWCPLKKEKEGTNDAVGVET